MSTRKVPEAEIDQIKELTRNHRAFKKRRRELVKAQKDLIHAIGQLESKRNEQARKPLSYLALAPKMVTQSPATARKTRKKKGARKA